LKSSQRLQQLVDGRFSKLRIGGMRHAALGDDFHPQSSFRSNRKAILRRLAIDEKLASASMLIGNLRALAVSFFAHQK
jgi:hypothetical protein